MTRGKLAIVTPDGMYITNEYNGDMYMNQAEYGPEAPISPGDIARKKIDEPTDLESFKQMVREFTKYYYGPEYAKCELTEEELEEESRVRELPKQAFNIETNEIDFDEYFKYWFSDFIYIKNASEKPVEVITREKAPVVKTAVIIEPGQSEVFYFGRVWTKEDE